MKDISKETLTQVFLSTVKGVANLTIRARSVTIRVGYDSNGAPVYYATYNVRRFATLAEFVKTVVAFRRESLAALPPRSRGRDRDKYPLKNNTSGINNICKRVTTTGSGKYYSWQASWVNKDGTQGSAAFSIRKWGDKTALSRATRCKNAKRNVFRSLRTQV